MPQCTLQTAVYVVMEFSDYFKHHANKPTILTIPILISSAGRRLLSGTRISVNCNANHVRCREYHHGKTEDWQPRTYFDMLRTRVSNLLPGNING